MLVRHAQSGEAIYKLLPSAAAFQYCFYVAAAVFITIAIVIAFAKEVLGKKAETNKEKTHERVAQANVHSHGKRTLLNKLWIPRALPLLLPLKLDPKAG